MLLTPLENHHFIGGWQLIPIFSHIMSIEKLDDFICGLERWNFF